MMKDMIDKRNERERIARSIIKYWNVNYIPRTQADSGMQKQTAEAENAQDQTMDPNMQEDYNKATNAYSGKYGQEKDLDEVTKDQIDKILHEKAEHIHQLFENGGVVTISCYSAYDITRKMAEESRCLRSYFANTMELAMII